MRVEDGRSPERGRVAVVVGGEGDAGEENQRGTMAGGQPN